MRIFLFKKTVYNCKQATMLALKKEQKKISLFEKLKLWYHLQYCNPCKRFIEQSQIINEAVKEIDQSLFNDPPFTLEEEQAEKIRQQLRSLDK